MNITRKPDTLEQRIADAEAALAQYPQWVRDNCYFEGGERGECGGLDHMREGLSTNLTATQQQRGV